MQVLILISATADSCGKTTLGSKFNGFSWGLADTIRCELSQEYPDVKFFDKTPEGKRKLVPGTTMTVRDLLIERGENRRRKNLLHWCGLWESFLPSSLRDQEILVVDDIRQKYEAQYFKEKFDNVIHFHIHDPSVTENKFFPDCVSLLKDEADYVIQKNW